MFLKQYGKKVVDNIKSLKANDVAVFCLKRLCSCQAMEKARKAALTLIKLVVWHALSHVECSFVGPDKKIGDILMIINVTK